MAEPPDPLVPADVDLRGLDYMPLFGTHLFGSDFNAACSDTEWRAGLTLWWAAWNQQPAGSLPDDEIALCRLADLGRDIKLFRKVKEKALRGFTKCSDGRLYHGFLCKQVLIAWEKRVQERERKRKWREKKEGQNADGDGDKHNQERGRNADVPADGKRRDVTGRDGNGRSKTVGLPECPSNVTEGVWKDYIALRAKSRAPLSQTALDGLQREADKAGMQLGDALRMCCERGWRGFKAEWVKGSGPPAEIGDDGIDEWLQKMHGQEKDITHDT